MRTTKTLYSKEFKRNIQVRHSGDHMPMSLRGWHTEHIDWYGVPGHSTYLGFSGSSRESAEAALANLEERAEAVFNADWHTPDLAIPRESFF